MESCTSSTHHNCWGLVAQWSLKGDREIGRVWHGSTLLAQYLLACKSLTLFKQPPRKDRDAFDKWEWERGRRSFFLILKSKMRTFFEKNIELIIVCDGMVPQHWARELFDAVCAVCGILSWRYDSVSCRGGITQYESVCHSRTTRLSSHWSAVITAINSDRGSV